MGDKMSDRLDEILKTFRHAVDEWAEKEAPSLRRRVMSSLQSSPSPFNLRWSLAAGMVFAVLFLGFVLIQNFKSPDTTLPTLTNQSAPASGPIVRVEKHKDRVVVKAEGVRGPIYLRKASDPRIVRKSPPIRLNKPVYSEPKQDNSPIVFYLVESPVSANDS